MFNARRFLTKEQILTIPNAMSVFRILLVPFIIWAYVAEHYYLVFGLLVLSALSDVLDGIVARKFNMTSEFGKFIDPVADKLTQVSLVVCLMTRYKPICILFVIIVVKEIVQSYLAAVVLKKCNRVNSAKWYGKLCTVVLEASIIALLIVPYAPGNFVWILTAVCAFLLMLAFVMYAIFFIGQLIQVKKQENQN